MFKRFLQSIMVFSVLTCSISGVLADANHSVNTSNDKNERPFVTDSWYKIVSFNWEKLSRDDAWNILGTIVVIGAAYVVITKWPTNNVDTQSVRIPQPNRFGNPSTLHNQSVQQVTMARQQLYNQLQQPYVMPYDFETYKQAAMQRYQQDIANPIMQRFASSGGLRSSAFRNAMQQGSEQFQRELRADYEKLRQQTAAQNLQRLSMLAQHFPNGLY